MASFRDIAQESNHATINSYLNRTVHFSSAGNSIFLDESPINNTRIEYSHLRLFPSFCADLSTLPFAI
jgi:hypothetical protein